MAAFFASWTSYVVSGVMAVLASWLLTGCRFGNHVEQSKNPDTWSGFYETEPRSLEFCSTYTSGSPTCVAGNASQQMPDLPAAILGNPARIAIKDMSTGEAYLYDPAQGIAITVFVDTNTGEFGLSEANSSSNFRGYPGCDYFVELEISGKIHPGTEKQIRGHITSGTLEVDIAQNYRWLGNCSAALTELRDCYGDLAACGGAGTEGLQEAVRALFDPFITTGVLTTLDAPNLNVLNYQVSYR